MFFLNPKEVNLKPRLLIFIFLFLFSSPIQAETVTRQKTIISEYDLSAKMSIQVTAHVTGYLFDLQGLTSPWAKVDFYSTQGNLEATTLADNDGIFHFQNVLAPVQTGDFCFLSYDTNGIANNPLCFSPPPPKTKTVITDIVLSPTLTLNKGLFHQGDLVEASGRTFPNAEIRIYMFEENRPYWLDLIDIATPKIFARPAFARDGPQLIVTADAKGDFSYNLPTQKSSLWRMFAGPKYNNGNMVAKSNIIEFFALSWWQWILFQLLQYCYKISALIYKLIVNWKTIFGLLFLAIGVIIVKSARLKVQNKKN